MMLVWLIDFDYGLNKINPGEFRSGIVFELMNLGELDSTVIPILPLITIKEEDQHGFNAAGKDLTIRDIDVTKTVIMESAGVHVAVPCFD